MLFGSTLKTRHAAVEGLQVVGTMLVWLQEELRAPVTADHRDRPNEILTEPLVFNQIKAAWAALVGATDEFPPPIAVALRASKRASKVRVKTVKWKPPTGTAGVPQAKQSTRLITEPGSHSRDGSQETARLKTQRTGPKPETHGKLSRACILNQVPKSSAFIFNPEWSSLAEGRLQMSIYLALFLGFNHRP